MGQLLGCGVGDGVCIFGCVFYAWLTLAWYKVTVFMLINWISEFMKFIFRMAIPHKWQKSIKECDKSCTILQDWANLIYSGSRFMCYIFDCINYDKVKSSVIVFYLFIILICYVLSPAAPVKNCLAWYAQYFPCFNFPWISVIVEKNTLQQSWVSARIKQLAFRVSSVFVGF